MLALLIIFTFCLLCGLLVVLTNLINRYFNYLELSKGLNPKSIIVRTEKNGKVIERSIVRNSIS